MYVSVCVHVCVHVYVSVCVSVCVHVIALVGLCIRVSCHSVQCYDWSLAGVVVAHAFHSIHRHDGDMHANDHPMKTTSKTPTHSTTARYCRWHVYFVWVCIRILHI